MSRQISWGKGTGRHAWGLEQPGCNRHRLWDDWWGPDRKEIVTTGGRIFESEKRRKLRQASDKRADVITYGGRSFPRFGGPWGFGSTSRGWGSTSKKQRTDGQSGTDHDEASLILQLRKEYEHKVRPQQVDRKSVV